MHTERPTEAKTIVILDMLKCLSDHRRPNERARVTFLPAQRVLRRSVSATYTYFDMCRSSEPCQCLERYILVTCYDGDHSAYQRRKRKTEPPTVARMSHVLQIVSAVHSRPAPQLIFTPLAGHGYN